MSGRVSSQCGLSISVPPGLLVGAGGIQDDLEGERLEEVALAGVELALELHPEGKTSK